MAKLLILKGKIRVSYLLLLLLPVISFFVSAKLFWSISVLILFLTIIENKGIIRTRHYSLLLYFIIPILIAILLSINDQSYFVIQSLFYLLTPILFLSIGMQYGSSVNKEDLLKYLIYYGTVGSLTFLSLTLIRVGSAIFTDIGAARTVTLWGSIANAATIGVVFFAPRNNINIFRSKFEKNWILVVNLLALLLTASRTYYLCLLIFLILFLYLYNKKMMVLFAVIFVFLLSSVLMMQTDVLFIQKIQNSLSEISNSQEFIGYDDVNTFYRAYETRQALDTYLSGSEQNIILGHGLEKMVDLEYYVLLGGDFRRYIPVLHNGYAYLLLREGLLGLLFFVLFFFKTIKIGYKNKKEMFMFTLLLGMIFSLIVSNYVVGTFFSTEMNFAWMFIGISIIHYEKGIYDNATD